MMRTMKLKWTRYGTTPDCGLEAFYECPECEQGVIVCDGKGDTNRVWPKEKTLACFGCELRKSNKKKKNGKKGI